MKKINKNKLIFSALISLCVVLILCMFFVYLFTDVSDLFANIITILATVIGAFASVVEYNKNNEVDLCNDILTIYGSFIDIPTNKDIQYKLECLKRRNVNLFTKDDITGIRNYLLYFNGVAKTILTNNIKIDKINTILGYRFFLVMNSAYIQDLEIIPNANAYRPCIQLHKKWKEWSEEHGFVRSGDATSLDKRFKLYDKYAEI